MSRFLVSAPVLPASAIPARAATALATALLGLLLPAALTGPATAQTAVSCAPFCDYRHYYGTYDYTYVQPGVYCRPICGPDGTCVPAKSCVRAPGAIPTTATVTFYDPTIATPGYVGSRTFSEGVDSAEPDL